MKIFTKRNLRCSGRIQNCNGWEDVDFKKHFLYTVLKTLRGQRKREDIYMKKGIIATISTVLGVAAGAAVVGKAASGETSKIKQMSEKHLALYLLMNRWVEVKQEGKNLVDYFHKNNYKTIAIYGMNYTGERLLNELKGSEVIVKYGIDQRADEMCTSVDLITMNDVLPEVDAIVVTPIFFFNEIRDKLSDKIDCPIVSLEDVLCEL